MRLVDAPSMPTSLNRRSRRPSNINGPRSTGPIESFVYSSARVSATCRVVKPEKKALKFALPVAR
jgi:hypothetical protein